MKGMWDWDEKCTIFCACCTIFCASERKSRVGSLRSYKEKGRSVITLPYIKNAHLVNCISSLTRVKRRFTRQSFWRAWPLYGITTLRRWLNHAIEIKRDKQRWEKGTNTMKGSTHDSFRFHFTNTFYSDKCNTEFKKQLHFIQESSVDLTPLHSS